MYMKHHLIKFESIQLRNKTQKTSKKIKKDKNIGGEGERGRMIRQIHTLCPVTRLYFLR